MEPKKEAKEPEEPKKDKESWYTSAKEHAKRHKKAFDLARKVS